MSYSKFKKLSKVESLGVTVRNTTNLFAHPWLREAFPLPDYFIEDLEQGKQLALASASEKAKSEFIITPILKQLWKTYPFGLFSGVDFSIDKKRKLTGVVDYILTEGPQTPELKNPICVIVEAKESELKRGLSQCCAEMFAAKLVNQNKGLDKVVYGIVTTGELWKFLKYHGDTIDIDTQTYSLYDLTALFNILRFITGNVSR